jgi:Ca2+-binding EF-hand superfamily protein
VARRLFKMFDKDNSGTLTENEIPFIIQETYREMGQTYLPSKEDVRSYLKMVDTDGDGKVSLPEFEEIILKSLKNAGFEIY